MQGVSWKRSPKRSRGEKGRRADDAEERKYREEERYRAEGQEATRAKRQEGKMTED